MLTNLLGHREQNRHENRVQPTAVCFSKAELGRRRLDIVKTALKYKILGLNASCCCSISVSVKILPLSLACHFPTLWSCYNLLSFLLYSEPPSKDGLAQLSGQCRQAHSFSQELKTEAQDVKRVGVFDLQKMSLKVGDSVCPAQGRKRSRLPLSRSAI